MALRSFHRPLLALAGTVAPSAALVLVGAATSSDIALVEVPGADRIFNVLAPDPDASPAVTETTAEAAPTCWCAPTSGQLT